MLHPTEQLTGNKTQEIAMKSRLTTLTVTFGNIESALNTRHTEPETTIKIKNKA